MINTNFTTFFTVEILNKYYSGLLCNDFSIIPSTQTRSVMYGYSQLCRQYNNQFYAGIMADGAGNAAFAPYEGTCFVFFLKCNNPLFYNFTNSPAGGLQGDMLYFTNKNNNPANGKFLLSAGISPYSGGAAYNAGDLALSGGMVYEAIKPNSGTPVADTTVWSPVDDDSYVSANDIKHIHRDPAEQAADPDDLINFLPAADYAELLSATNVCGVINIVNDSSLPDGYKLLNAAQIKSPLFTIYFLNRAALWKYILAPASTGTVTQVLPISTAPAFAATTTLSNQIASVFPLRFYDIQPAANAFQFQLTTNGGQTIATLPLASPEMIKPPQSTGGPFYAEIYLNY